MTCKCTRPFFVAFEGLDGSGKSTCAAQAARNLGAEYLTTPSPLIRQFRGDIVASFGSSQEAAQLFYLSTVFAASGQVRSLLSDGRSVVMDRYFLSTQAYAQFRGSRLELDELHKHLVPADLTVYLDAPLAVRRQRLEARHCTHEDRETLTAAADDRLRALHAQRSELGIVGRWLRIDSAQASPAEITCQIVRALKSLGTS